MKALRRVAASAARGHRNSPGRFVMLVLLIAIGLIIFLIVSSLSRASTDQLNEAIEDDVGAAGTYRISFSRTLGLEGKELTRRVAHVVDPMSARPLRVVEVFAHQSAECPPFTNVGEARLSVLRDAAFQPVDLPFGENLPPGVAFCLSGLNVPGAGLYFPDEVGKRLWGSGTVLVEDVYAPQIALVGTESTQYEFLMITGRPEAMQETISVGLETELADELGHMAFNPRDVFTVHRIDSGDSVRAASDGVRLVYGIIAWGVLLLGGLGILVAQLIMLRDRTWFFGLSRAVGATPGHVAALVLADAAVVVMSGVGLALVLAVVGQPLVTSFGMVAFQVPLSLLDWQVVPQLAIGVVAVLLIGAAFPAWKAMLLDPLEILERR